MLVWDVKDRSMSICTLMSHKCPWCCWRSSQVTVSGGSVSRVCELHPLEHSWKIRKESNLIDRSIMSICKIIFIHWFHNFILASPPIVKINFQHKRRPCAGLNLVCLWCLTHVFCSSVNVMSVVDWLRQKIIGSNWTIVCICIILQWEEN